MRQSQMENIGSGLHWIICWLIHAAPTLTNHTPPPFFMYIQRFLLLTTMKLQDNKFQVAEVLYKRPEHTA